LNIVLLDADVIIDLHRFNVWNQIISKNKIYISSIILRQEVYYYEDYYGVKHNIELLKDVGTKFSELSASVEDLKEFLKQFDRVFEEELHSGEKEALKILQDNKNMLFCTCDKAAIKAIALIGKREQGISFERLLKSSGINKKIEFKHTEKLFKKYLDEGSIMRIQKIGIIK
jgi:hypothetical protein